MAGDEPDTPVPCSACRGTGRVTSNLGGERREVPCPWCEGRGRRISGEHDAQAHWRKGDGTPPDAA